MKILRTINIILLSVFILMVIYGLSFGACSGSSPTLTAASCSKADVSACLTAAAPGDTVQIPAGTCNTDWTSVLDVTKPITIQGAGVDQTIITANVTAGGSSNYVFRVPNSVSSNTYQTNSWGATNQPIYASGRWVFKDMTINTQYKSGHFLFSNPSSDMFQLQVQNVKMTGAQHVPSSGFMYRNTIKVEGSWEGVFSGNYISGNPYIKIMGPDDAGRYAITHTREPAFSSASNTIYFEDNTIVSSNYNQVANTLSLCTGEITTFTLDGINGKSYCDTSCDCSGSQYAISANNGQQWVWRYNTITNESSQGGASMYFDHGPIGGGSLEYLNSTLSSGLTIEGVWYKIITTEPNHFCTGCVAGQYFQGTSSIKTINTTNTVQVVYSVFNTGIYTAEVYGNKYNIPYRGSILGIERTSGRGFAFNNYFKLPGTSYTQYSTFNPDTIISSGETRQWMHTCPTDAEHLYGGTNTCTAGGVPQHITRSYDWNNRYGNVDTGVGTLLPTRVYDKHIPPVANQNFWSQNDSCTASSCSSGVGCGSTIPTGTCTTGVGYWRTNQSCSALTSGSFGANPTAPISGEFYRCTATNTWTYTYAPLQYPHPWIEVEVESPQGSTPAPTGQQACSGDTGSVNASINFTDNVGVTGVKACLDGESLGGSCGTCSSSTTYDCMDKSFSLLSGSILNGTWGTTFATEPCGEARAYNVKGTDGSDNISSNYVISYDMESSSDITNPTLSSQSIGVNGRTLTLTFSEPINNGGAYSDSHWSLVVDGSPMSITCTQSWLSTTLLCQTAECVESGVTVTLDFDQPVGNNSIIDIAENPLEDFDPAKSVTNNSTQSCGAATSLFYPDVLSYTTNTDVPSNLGMVFQSTLPGTIDEVCFYKDATLTGTHIASVWDNSCTKLAEKTFSGETGTGWQCQALDTSVPFLADTPYRVAVLFPTSAYIKVGSFFASQYTENNLSIPSGGGRYYDSSSVGCPTATTQSNFLVDVIVSYQGASGPWQVNTEMSGAGCSNITASSLVDDEDTKEITVTVGNGWQVSVTGCGGSGSLSGNTYTYTTGSVTENCTVTATCTEINRMPWAAP